MKYRHQIYLPQSEEVCWTTSHLLFSDILQPQSEPDLRWRCLWIGFSFASEPEPSDTKVSPTLHVLLLKRCTLVLQQWLCTLSTGVAVPVQYMVGFGWSYWNAWYSLASYQGSQWVGKIRAWYPLFAHALNFSEILGDRELSRCICTTVTFITCSYYYTAHTLSDQWWSFLIKGGTAILVMQHFLVTSSGQYSCPPNTPSFLRLWALVILRVGLGEPVPLLPLWLHVCTHTHS